MAAKDITGDGKFTKKDLLRMRGVPGFKKGGTTKKKKTKAEANFKPHMMYDKKSGKGVRAGTFKKHLDLKKKGYGHTKPKKKTVKKRK